MKKLVWLMLLIGCSSVNLDKNLKKPILGKQPTQGVIGRQSPPAEMDSAKVLQFTLIKAELPFIDWATWPIVDERGPLSFRSVKKQHPYQKTTISIAIMKRGVIWEVYIKTKYGCLAGPMAVISGNPIYIFALAPSCDVYDSIDSIYFDAEPETIK